jgi:hypothetical protein
MLPTDSIEKPPIAGRASGSIASFSNSYARLPEHFFARLPPTPVGRPQLIKFNDSLASELGIDIRGLDPDELAAMFAGNVTPPGAEPIAMAYAGHQFGNFVPRLGDGRAILLGEVLDRNGLRRDIQLKGSGRTPFSRRGDGRAALGSVLREYLVSEAMHALGIPTTRALAAVITGEPVYRDRQLPGAVLTRVASSHIRVGTFQYFAARGDLEGVKRLADYVIDRHFPDARNAERPYLALLQGVAERQALLIARWMQVGFIHGVMNTDNTALSGETIDFGPCAFMDSYDPATVFSAIDEFGRYAYANQPTIALASSAMSGARSPRHCRNPAPASTPAGFIEAAALKLQRSRRRKTSLCCRAKSSRSRKVPVRRRSRTWGKGLPCRLQRRSFEILRFVQTFANGQSSAASRTSFTPSLMASRDPKQVLLSSGFASRCAIPRACV